MLANIDIRKICGFAALALLTAGAARAAWVEQEGAVNADLPEMVVEAENEVRQDIQKRDVDFPLGAAVIDTFWSREDEEIMVRSPVGGLQSLVNNPGTLGGDQIPHYWTPEMASSPLATFYPEDPEGHEAVAWTLTVTDFRGSPYREFRSEGSPPRAVSWDGRSDRGEILKAGYPYSFLYSVTDKGTNTYNYAGVSFRIPAMDYREGRDRHLDFAGDRMFRRGRWELKPEGVEWLVAAADIVRRDNPFSPLRVHVVASDERVAAERADAVARVLTESMILAPDWVEVETAVRPDLRAELDGLVSVRVEHAD